MRALELERDARPQRCELVVEPRRPDGVGLAQRCQPLTGGSEPRAATRAAASGLSRPARSAASGSSQLPQDPARCRRPRAPALATRARLDDVPAQGGRERPYPLSSSRSAGSSRSVELSPNGRSTRPIAARWSGVEVDDPPPLRVHVDLGRRDEHRRARAARAGQELELRAGQLGGRIGHEDQRVGRREERERRRGVAGVQATDPRRIDERQPTFEQRVRQPAPRRGRRRGAAPGRHVRASSPRAASGSIDSMTGSPSSRRWMIAPGVSP